MLLNEQADGLHDALAAVGSSTTALASHGVKAGLRMAVNLSPDPVTTATASLTEDFLVGCVVALIVTHPWLALTLSMTLLAIGLALVSLLWRRVRAKEIGVSPARRACSFLAARLRRRYRGAIRRFVSANDVIFLNAGPATVPP